MVLSYHAALMMPSCHQSFVSANTLVRCAAKTMLACIDQAGLICGVDTHGINLRGLAAAEKRADKLFQGDSGRHSSAHRSDKGVDVHKSLRFCIKYYIAKQCTCPVTTIRSNPRPQTCILQQLTYVSWCSSPNVTCCWCQRPGDVA